jgi:hypothetical protein
MNTFCQFEIDNGGKCVPLTTITCTLLPSPNLLGGGKLGNIIVWLSVILGQPLCILMYFHDWYLITYPQDVIAHLNGNFSEIPEILK